MMATLNLYNITLKMFYEFRFLRFFRSFVRVCSFSGLFRNGNAQKKCLYDSEYYVCLYTNIHRIDDDIHCRLVNSVNFGQSEYFIIHI